MFRLVNSCAHSCSFSAIVFVCVDFLPLWRRCCWHHSQSWRRCRSPRVWELPRWLHDRGGPSDEPNRGWVSWSLWSISLCRTFRRISTACRSDICYQTCKDFDAVESQSSNTASYKSTSPIGYEPLKWALFFLSPSKGNSPLAEDFRAFLWEPPNFNFFWRGWCEVGNKSMG